MSNEKLLQTSFFKTKTASTPIKKVGSFDQLATKLDANTYMTEMNGVKFKVGHKRPHWKQFSYQYPEQLSYKERVIQILENIITKLRKS